MLDVRSLREGDPERLGRYRVRGRLGAGGQGVVYLAAADDGEPVAIKVLRALDARARARFAKEVAASRRVPRFCTAAVLDADVEAVRPYVVGEYVQGPSLAELVNSLGPRSGSDLDDLALGALTALAAIHSAGVVHRDFKPANLLLGPDGPRVIDFGIARVLDATATLTNHAVGTPAYMAPEQVSGEVAGPPADMFAWAATVIFAATGRPPFGADSVPAILRKITSATPDLSGLPAHLHDLVAECLAKDPAARPTSAAALQRLLAASKAADGPVVGQAIQATRVLAKAPVQPVPARPPRRGVRHVRRAATAAGLALLGAAAVTTWTLIPDAPGRADGQRTAAPGVPPAWLQRSWAGVTDRRDQRWTVRLAFGPDGRSGAFALPSLGCAGTFAVVGTSTTAVNIRTTLTRRPDRRCRQQELLRVEYRSLLDAVRVIWPTASGRPLTAMLTGEQPGQPQRALRGTWVGTIGPRGVRITITAGSGIAGTVEYVRRNCRGRLGLVSTKGEPGDQDQRVWLIEDFHGSRCADAGTFELSRQRTDGTIGSIERGLRARYVSAGGTVATGTLHRAGS
jgi:predicted Ser/Thr protein kinase